ncbi:MAG: CHASE2 domain-containing protein [Gammaproteobacteria bacterium]|nr:CHASE2 domain-containing protein [Gammaproteobacteria bacterium]
MLIALGFLALLVVDPLNAGSGSGQRSEQAILRIAAPFYDASDAVTVVLIDDTYLQRVGAGWPLRYGEQGLLLRRILAHEPAAMFVDLLYRHRHERADGEAGAAEGMELPVGYDDPLDLVRPLSGATEQPVPVLFAALTRDDPAFALCPDAWPGTPPPRPQIVDPESVAEALRAPFGLTRSPGPAASASGPQLGTALVSWSGCGTGYPLLLAGSPEAPTPAMALYDATCRRRPGLPGCKLGGAAPLQAAARFATALTVRWGAFAPNRQQPFYAEGTCQRYTDVDGHVPWATRLWRSMQQLVLGAVFNLRGKDDPELALPCPAVPVIRADAILDGDRATVDALLRGRAVLVGASVSGIPDWQPSGVHGLVPGVVWHAMALDNLLVHGDGYLRPLGKNASRAISVLLAALAALLAPWIVARQPWLRDPVRASIGLALWLAYAAVLLAHGHPWQALAVIGVALAFDLIKPAETWRLALLFVAMSALAMLAVALGRSPWNWIGLVFVVLATIETLKSYLKGGAPKPFPHPASRLRAGWTRWGGGVRP